MFDFHGERILVSGAASGIGNAIARALVAEHATVIGVDVAPAVTELDSIDGHQLDLTDRDAVRAFVDGLGELHGLVNAAGIMREGEIFNFPDSQWDQVLDVNLKAPFYLIQECANRFADGASVVNISSIGGVSAVNFEAAAYHASKGALIIATKSWARALAPRGIRVNAVLPGLTDTPMLKGIFEHKAASSGESVEDLRAAAASGIPLGRLAQPSEIASAVSFLLSPASSYITGTAVNVSGGIVM